VIRPEEWQPVGRLELEPNALAAIRAIDSNVVVAAGPGAGKTELLAQRADFLFRTGQAPYPRRILAISFKVDAARNLGDRVRARSGAQYAARFDSLTFHAFAKRLIDNYRPALTEQNALNPDYRVDRDARIQGEQITFREFVPFALEILEANRYARGALRQTYSHVFLDEFQDATNEQYELVKAAFGATNARLTAVGDVKQRIMAWAGALDGVMQRYVVDFDATALTLYQNFRSRPRLRRMQNRMILDMEPSAASPPDQLVGENGTIGVLHFRDADAEAVALADTITGWLADETPPSEIAVLIRNQPHLVAATLGEELTERGIAFRNEQESQDLTTEPAALLVLSYLRVVADERRPDAYAALLRVAAQQGNSDTDDAVIESKLRRHLAQARSQVRDAAFKQSDFASWKPLLGDFLKLTPRARLKALSPSYHQGKRLDEVLMEALTSFKRELGVDGNPVAALNRLSEEDAIRFLTIHKCKGLEFEKVIVLGVETELFFGNPADVMSEYFVAISRAKDDLIITSVDYRAKPDGAGWRWSESRTPYEQLIAYTDE
jgi:superfamily I DNA/RNA helicase